MVKKAGHFRIEFYKIHKNHLLNAKEHEAIQILKTNVMFKIGFTNHKKFCMFYIKILK